MCMCVSMSNLFPRRRTRLATSWSAHVQDAERRLEWALAHTCAPDYLDTTGNTANARCGDDLDPYRPWPTVYESLNIYCLVIDATSPSP
jgi:hypothetical protein